MGLWDNTAYLKCDDLDLIERALAELFELERRQPVPMPPARKPARHDPMQYQGADENELWAVALVPGAGGWTILKTAPFELLCERARGMNQPRLAGLTAALGVDGFQLNLYDGDSIVVLEATSNGEIALSGFCSQSEDPSEWHDMRIEQVEAGIRMISVDESVAAALEEGFAERAALRVQSLLAGGEVSNSIQVSYLIPHHELLLANARACFFRVVTTH